jgi:small conductance mechanosensitive channel
MGFNLLVLLGTCVSFILWRVLHQWIFSNFSHKLSESNYFILEKVSFYIGVLLISIATLNVLDVDINDVLATAGVLTLAIGFAAKTAIANFISGLIMLSNKKLSISDLIQVDQYLGIVENIDIFSTRLRTFDNILINIPNEKLLTEYISNFSQYPIRRVNHEFLIHYQDFNQEVLDQLDAVLGEVSHVLVEPAPLLLVDNDLGRGIIISARVWCESDKFIQTQNNLVIACLAFFQSKNIRCGGDFSYGERNVSIERTE